MALKNEEIWMANYEALKTYVVERGHFPQKHTRLWRGFTTRGRE